MGDGAEEQPSFLSKEALETALHRSEGARSRFHEAEAADEEIVEVAGSRVKCCDGVPIEVEQRCAACGQPYWVPVRTARSRLRPLLVHDCAPNRLGGAAVINKYG